jgi:hypothetical protein
LGVYLALLGYGFVRFGRRLSEAATAGQVRRALDFRLLLSWFGIPILMVYLISLPLPIPQKRSLYVDRYLIMTLPALLVAVAWSLVALTDRRAGRWPRAALLLIIAVISGRTLLSYYGDASYGREDWRSALTDLEALSRPGDVVLGRPDHILPLDYYGVEEVRYAELPAAVDDEALLDVFDQEMGRRVALAAPASGQAWLITHFYISDVHGFPQGRNQQLADLPESNLQKLWLDAHYNMVEQREFVGIRLTLYDLTSPLVDDGLWRQGAAFD